MRRIAGFTLIVCTLFSLGPPPLFGQVEITGDIAITTTALDKYTPLNVNFRNDNPFNPVRLRFFVRTPVTENIDLFSEVLMDNAAGIRMNGAYLSFRNLVTKRVDMKVGLIPSPFGNYGLRSTYFNLNSLIGVPILWHYKTGLPLNKVMKNEEFVDTSGNVNTFPTSRFGTMPVRYDACWDIGGEITGFFSHLELSGAMTLGASGSARGWRSDGYQFIGKASLSPFMGLKFGLSYAEGPFLLPDSTDPYGVPTMGSIENDLDEYHQKLLGGFVEFQRGHMEFFSEYARSRWEEPLLWEKEVGVTTGYTEAKYTFLPGWFIAGRFDILRYSTINTRSDGTGPKRAWGHDVNRIEAGIGWRLNRQTLLKGVYQRWDFTGEADVDLAALQVSVAF